MGIKNYNEQLAQIKKASSVSEILKDYAKKTNALILSLNEEWTGGDEKVNFLNALGDCVQMSVDLANDYDTFYRNAKKWLDEMNQLDKISKSLVSYHNYNLIPAKGEKSGAGWIKVNTNTLISYANKIQTNNSSLQDGYLMANGLYTGIDKLITSRFTSRYSVTGMKVRYIELKKQNKDLAGKLRSVSDLFDKADRRIKVSITGEVDSETAVGKVVAEIGSTLKDALKDGKISKEEWESIKVALGESNLLEQLKKDLGKYLLDDYAFIPEVIQMLVEHEYEDALKKLGNELVDLVFDEQDGFMTAKITVIKEAIMLCGNPDGYVRKDDEKYTDIISDSILEGNLMQAGAGFTGLIVTEGKAMVDVTCKVIDGVVDGIPIVGDALDYTNAVLEDLTGTSPELMLDEAGDTISNGVTWFVDSAIEGAGHVDDFLQDCGSAIGDVAVAGAETISSGVKGIGNWITSLW